MLARTPPILSPGRFWKAFWGLALSSPLLAGAATYYVDFSAGSDLNAGTEAEPFQHCPGDGNAADKAAGVALAAGDTVIFKGGATYVGSITCPASGVTYDGNSAGTFGTGRAVFDGQNNTVKNTGFTATGRTGLTFTNLEMESYGGHGSSPWTGQETAGLYGYAIYLDECSGATVKNCYFHDLGDWQNVANANEAYMEGVGVEVIDSASAITISGNEFTRIGRAGVLIDPRQGSQACTGIAITGNNFHDFLRWGVCLTTGNAGCTLDGVTIDGNQFHDIYEYETGSWLGLPGDAPHVDCVIAYIGGNPPQGGQTLGTAAKPIVVSNNSFYNNATVAQVQNAAVFLNTWGGRVLICNNTFINTLFDGNGAIFCLEGTAAGINPAPDYWIANNSFYDTTYGVTLESSLYPLKNGDVHVLNNIFYKPDAGNGYSVRVMDANSTPTQLDYNLYFTGRPDNQLGLAPAGAQTLAQLRDAGYELHGAQLNPLYADVAPGLGAESSSNNLQLQSSSPAIGRGLNLADLFTTDRDGTARPASSAWDAGAYEFAAAVAASPPPASTSTPTNPATASTASASRLVNLSVRAYASTGANVIVAGFAVSGGSAQLLMRGIGPGLGQFGVSGFLADPLLSLYSGSKLLQSNDAWGGTAALEAAFDETGAFALSPSSKDAAILATVPAGSYSAQVGGANGANGVAMAELYDADPAGSSAGRLVNLSGRAKVGAGGDVLIIGFSISGDAPETVLLRGVGPSLAQFGISGTLASPQLDLYQNSTLIQRSSGVSAGSSISAVSAQVGAFALTGTKDAAMIVTLQPGQYTAQVSGLDGATGVALAEIYAVP